MRNALVLFSLFVASAAYADVPRDPPRPRPEQSAPPPQRPAPSAKACGTGAAMVLAGIAAYGLWRFTKTPATGVAA